MANGDLYIGLMTGTSLDGVDAVLADLATRRPRVLAKLGLPLPVDLRGELLALNTTGPDELGRAAQAGNRLAVLYAGAVTDLLRQTGLTAPAILAIGCHGQTVRHRPDLGYTVQIGNAALLAELSGIPVVSDFRSRDIAAGGQGAPLVPAFHSEMFRAVGGIDGAGNAGGVGGAGSARKTGEQGEDRAILNLGGIANVSYIPQRGAVIGFDCGPGNCLLDLWAARHLRQPYDTNGAWSMTGTASPALLNHLLAEPYFAAPFPKSTGRDLFNERWLDGRLAAFPPTLPPEDVQATLIDLTVRSIGLAIRSCGSVQALVVCGGGVHNQALLDRLKVSLSSLRVETSAAHGVDPDYVEALAFAWLAQRSMKGETANLPAVTGARGARVLGAVYPR